MLQLPSIRFDFWNLIREILPIKRYTRAIMLAVSIVSRTQARLYSLEKSFTKYREAFTLHHNSRRTKCALVKTWINAPFISFSSFQTKYWNFQRLWFFLSKRSLRALSVSFEETVEKVTINGDWCLSNPHDVMFSFLENHSPRHTGANFHRAESFRFRKSSRKGKNFSQ